MAARSGFFVPPQQPVMVFGYGAGSASAGLQARDATSGLGNYASTRTTAFGGVQGRPDPCLGLAPSPNIPLVPPVRGGVSSRGLVDSSYEIHLLFEGAVVSIRVRPSTSVLQLAIEAGQFSGLDPDRVVLILFLPVPTQLQRGDLLSDPPTVGPGARVMVVHVAQPVHRPGTYRPEPRAVSLPDMPTPPLNSKLLSTFKLPKFDGVARSWKLWEKSFQRFLELHQLDYVLEEDFMELLWVTP